MNAEASAGWYAKSAWFNHDNFTRMLRFAAAGLQPSKSLRFLDYGCGGGQFALVAKSHFPFSEVFSVDASDDALLKHWRCLQHQIPFAQFGQDETRFDLIFLNDVLEHLADPISVLRLLSSKLEPDGKVFIDTPKSFWLYPFTRAFWPSLHEKLLRGTVSLAHLQIWSRKAFEISVKKAGLQIYKYKELSEYTMPATFYLDNMGIHSRAIRLVGSVFYSQAKLLARNKIMALLRVQPV
jgi:2-polyprenyl-3-methyl-5-hydroxy-6-metoxy-1,4-benzoquinol methylase